MKKITFIFSVLALAAGLASCGKVEFTERQFATFQAASYSCTEDGGTLTVPVKVKSTGATSVAFKVIEKTATSGTFFNLQTTGGVLNFAENQAVDAQGYKTGSIVFDIINQSGLYTGNAQFAVELESATNDVQLGANNYCTITIKDNDHPLVDFFGSWSMTHDGSGYSPAVVKSTWSADEKDVTKVWIENFDNDSATGKYYAFISDDHKTITMPLGQVNTVKYSGTYDVVLWALLDDGNFYDETEIEGGALVFTLQDDGTYVSPLGAGIMAFKNGACLGYLNYMFGPLTLSK